MAYALPKSTDTHDALSTTTGTHDKPPTSTDTHDVLPKTESTQEEILNPKTCTDNPPVSGGIAGENINEGNAEDESNDLQDESGFQNEWEEKVDKDKLEEIIRIKKQSEESLRKYKEEKGKLMRPMFRSSSIREESIDEEDSIDIGDVNANSTRGKFNNQYLFLLNIIC